MDIGNSLASLLANASSYDRLLSCSIGLSKVNSISVNGDYAKVVSGSVQYESVPVLGLTGKISLPDNLEASSLLYYNGSAANPALILHETPYYKEEPTVTGFVGMIIVGQLLYYSFGAGLIPIAPYGHKHYAGVGTQGADLGGDMQQDVAVKIVEKTGWQLGD